jgi:hypothetical protein
MKAYEMYRKVGIKLIKLFARHELEVYKRCFFVLIPHTRKQ